MHSMHDGVSSASRLPDSCPLQLVNAVGFEPMFITLKGPKVIYIHLEEVVGLQPTRRVTDYWCFSRALP